MADSVFRIVLSALWTLRDCKRGVECVVLEGFVEVFAGGFFLSDLGNGFSIWSTDGCRVRVCRLWVLGVRIEDSYESFL